MKLYKSKAFMFKRYVRDRKTPKQIADECGVSEVTIYAHLKQMELLRGK